jgi:(1->4)-alpha-D-glucan 1-alpha-D-glucosylmutase
VTTDTTPPDGAGRTERTGDRLPRATYRLQLVPDRGFAYAASLCGYLADLGVSHLYLSPSLEAVPGSQHGYDVTDPGRIRDELGGAEGLDTLRDAARAAGLGLILDIVPNHVGLVSPWNPWWWDVLQHGPYGRYGGHLDVLWRDGAHGQPTLLLPELGGTLEEELAGDHLQLAWGDEPVGAAPVGWRVAYHEHLWPVRPGSLAAVGLDDEDREATLAAVATDRDLLARLLDHQHYRLACWLDANDHLDHRRFFAVSTLGGVRIEDPEVFADAHAQVLPRVQDGTFDGLRIDHPDGLTDPVGYLERVRDAIGPEPWLIVEKILERGERFRTDWPVDGTVGYELTDVLLKLHADPAGVAALDELHTQLTGDRLDRATAAIASQRFVLDTMFGTEVRRLTDHLLAATDALDEPTAHEVVTELLVAWPTYRTYVRPDTGEASEIDREVVAHAVSLAAARRPELTEPLDHVAGLLTTDGLAAPGSDERAAQEAFVWRFQQQTGPAIAKGFEDTVLYRDLRFTAVNEVGSDPGHVEASIGELHELHVQVQADRPATMRLSSTHDTKRSHDVRARLVTLSQDADHWVRTVHRLRDLAAPYRGELGPTPSHEHLVLQTLVGAWPIERPRLEDYLLKAVREGGEATDHLQPNERYEAELLAYVRGVLDDERLVDELSSVVDELAPAGWATALSMLLVTLTAPGVPDVYQGDELWDLSLVDPDNRRPVDHELRRSLLVDLDGEVDAGAVLQRWEEGLPKLYLLQRALQLRARRPVAFGPHATYQPLFATGPRSEHVLAFGRSDEVVAVAPVRVRQLGDRFGAWSFGDTSVSLPTGTWRDVLTGAEQAGGSRRVDELLATWPVALLERA